MVMVSWILAGGRVAASCCQCVSLEVCHEIAVSRAHILFGVSVDRWARRARTVQMGTAIVCMAQYGAMSKIFLNRSCWVAQTLLTLLLSAFVHDTIDFATIGRLTWWLVTPFRNRSATASLVAKSIFAIIWLQANAHTIDGCREHDCDSCHCMWGDL